MLTCEQALELISAQLDGALTAEEAGSLLDSYTPISESDGTLVYELIAAEYTALLQQLEQQGLAIAGAATAEEAEADGTILVHVIPG